MFDFQEENKKEHLLKHVTTVTFGQQSQHVNDKRAVQMRTIIGGGNGGTNLGHLFQFAADQISDAGALLSAQHMVNIRGANEPSRARVWPSSARTRLNYTKLDSSSARFELSGPKIGSSSLRNT
ncbi:hypothetical protein LXL04_013525 [Taraxacum kok-saghyz]